MSAGSSSSVTTVKKPSAEDRQKFSQVLSQVAKGEKNVEQMLTVLGAARQPGETASLAREELKKILEKNEALEDILGLETGALWTMEEEKLFEYGLYLHDGSTPDRFGQISNVMCGARSREECRRRYMKLVLDVCQIEMGQKTLSVVYFAPYQMQPTMGSQGPWM